LRAQLAGAKTGAPLESYEDAAPAGSSAASPSEADDVAPVSPSPAIAATPVTAAVQSTRAQTVAHAPAPASAPATGSAATPPDRTGATPTPREPGLAARALRAAREWLFGGNTVVRVGIVVLFFGVAFLLKYAADNDLLPIEFRLAGTALAATVLLALGWRLRARRAAYGLVLQGGGVGLLYLTVFAATKRYELLPVGAAFALMVAICALSAFLAIRQNAMSLATMGSAGGFLAPVLLSTGHGNHVALFGYYALLNAGIFAIAWFKAWRPLNLLGFVFTFTIGSLWGAMSYRPALFASTEPFLVLFFLMYVGIALLYAVRR